MRLSKNYRFSDNLCFDFAKHGRPKVPMRKLSTSRSIKTVIHKVNCRIAAREGGLGHAPGFYDFAQQNSFHARSRAKRNTIEKLALSTDRGLAVFLHFSKKLLFETKLLHFIHKRHLTLGRSGDKLCLALREMEC